MDEKKVDCAAAAERPKRGAVRFVDRADGGIEQVTPIEEAAGSVERMFGVPDTGTMGSRLLGQVLRTMGSLHGGAVSADDANDAAQLLESIAPRDPVEGMLVMQMIAAHSGAMRCMELAFRKGQSFDGRESYLNRATKLMRTFAGQVDALNRHRAKARQTLIVKHVHVHEGGQAIVANVSRGNREGGQL